MPAANLGVPEICLRVTGRRVFVTGGFAVSAWRFNELDGRRT